MRNRKFTKKEKNRFAGAMRIFLNQSDCGYCPVTIAKIGIGKLHLDCSEKLSDLCRDFIGLSLRKRNWPPNASYHDISDRVKPCPCLSAKKRTQEQILKKAHLALELWESGKHRWQR